MKRSCTFFQPESACLVLGARKNSWSHLSLGRPRPCVDSPPSTHRLFSEPNLRKDEGVGSASVLRCRVPGITRNPGSAQGKTRFGGQFNVVARSSCTTSGHHHSHLPSSHAHITNVYHSECQSRTQLLSQPSRGCTRCSCKVALHCRASY